MKILVQILADDGGALANRQYSARVFKELTHRKSVSLPDDFKDEIEQLAAEVINKEDAKQF